MPAGPRFPRAVIDAPRLVSSSFASEGFPLCPSPASVHGRVPTTLGINQTLNGQGKLYLSLTAGVSGRARCAACLPFPG